MELFMSTLEQREKSADGNMNTVCTIVGNEILEVVALGDIDFEGV
jgi:hypothetical protein